MNPTPKQLEVIQSDAKLTVVLAGAGSGKSSTLIARVKRLIFEGCPAHRICLLTFTNQASQVFAEKLNEMEPPTVPHCPVAKSNIKVGFAGTLHGYILRLLMAHGGKIGLPAELTVLDDEEATALRVATLKELGFKISMNDFEASLAKYPHPNSVMARPIDLAISAYFKKIQSSGMVDYETMLILGLKLVKKLAEEGMSLGNHLLIDEVQDSGDRDFAIYKALPFINKTLVGDTDQSIYSFRGGRMAHLLAATKAPGAKVVALEQNFRSLPVICEAANRLIEHNKERFAKKTISARVNVDEGSVFNGVVLMPAFASAPLECRFIAERINHYTANDIKPSEIAVLCRTNHLVNQIRESLLAQGIQVAQRKFTAIPPDLSMAKLFISLLSNPNNDYLALKWIAAKEGEKKAADVKRLALHAIKSVNDAYLKIPKGECNPTLTAPILRSNGINETSIAIVAAAAAKLPAHSDLHDLSLALTHDWAPDEEAGEGVHVGTVHGGKGKEWDVVFVAGLEDETIPGNRQNVDVSEERRVAFVAITRARFQLYLTWCASRIPAYGPQVPQRMRPSRYLAEIVDSAKG